MANPFLFQKSNGYYHIAYPDEYTGKRLTKTTKTKIKTKANRILTKFEEKLNEEKKHKSILFSEFAKTFIELSTDKTSGTLKGYAIVIKQFLVSLKDRPLQQYSILDLDRFLKSKEKTHSAGTANHYRKCLNVVFEKAVTYNYLSKNIVRECIRFKLPEPEPHPMTKEQFNKFLSVVETEVYRDLFTFAVLTGMRLSEIINLKPAQIDIHKRTITVLSNSEHRTKSGKTRFVEFHPALIPMYEKYKGREYFFIGDVYNHKFSRKFVGKITKRFVKRSGIGNEFTFHSLRSTFAVWLLLEGVPLKYISESLGHSSQSITERAYLKYITTEHRGWVGKLQL